jgi:hypothetical protein
MAQAQDFDTCAILANRFQPDVLRQGSMTQLFSQLQQLVNDQRYADWNNASSSSNAFNFGFSIPTELDAAIGDNQTSNSTNWGLRRSQFLSMNFQQTGSLFRTSTFLSQMSVGALNAITQCATTIAGLKASGFVAMLDKINDDRKSFAVKLTYKTGGNPDWSLTQFNVQPSDPGFNCIDGFEKASMEHPIKLNQLTQEINCAKSPNSSLTLVIQTTAGAADAIGLTSLNEEIQRLRDDMTAQIQSQAAQIAQQKIAIDAVSGRLATFKIAVGSPQTGKIYNQGDFWTAAQNTSVNFICPGNDVLAGMNFVMWSDGVGRHPSRVEYICKTLGP